ncbi:MAG TPA: c-type cytochrome biogenesis protein CcmI [Burkholderiales bacterium]|nr:c-type cytochrome biogenesis protein CcmI [Burkholderiales bacterium]
MIVFWIIAALLGTGALVYVLRPLLKARKDPLVSRRAANISIYRDQMRELDADRAAGTLAQEDYERSKLELESRLLDDVATADPSTVPSHGRRAALVVGIAVPLAAIGIYMATGNLRGLEPHLGAPSEAQVEAMVARLAAKMRENPADVEGWKLLGRSYAVMGRYDDSVKAFAQAAERSPRDPQLLADFADVLAMSRGGNLAGEPERLVEQAVKLDPKNLKALALLGTAAYERKDFARAAEVWARMLPLVPEGSEDARAIGENVAEARKLASIGGSPRAHPGVRGTVRLDARLKKDVKPDDVLFVFARAPQGPPMPLAVIRARAADLPLQFSLDDSLAMAQGMTVSSQPKIVVTARIAKSGKPQPAAGDMEGKSKVVANDAAGVDVVIDSVIR